MSAALEVVWVVVDGVYDADVAVVAEGVYIADEEDEVAIVALSLCLERLSKCSDR